jgi:hypothetical protein
MMRVTIDGELFAECEGVMPYRWNGFLEPIFTEEQMLFVQSECVRLGWDGEMEDGVRAHLDGWEYLGNGEWTVSGWVWTEVEGD